MRSEAALGGVVGVPVVEVSHQGARAKVLPDWQVFHWFAVEQQEAQGLAEARPLMSLE